MTFQHPWAEAIVAIAEAAAADILSLYQHSIQVEYKADHSPLTQADRLANARILEGLHALSPDIPVLSEEDSPAYGRANWGKERYWLVDPLDGTKEFIKRNGEFTVNIALIEAGKPVLGVVQAPAMGWCYLGSQRDGAWKKTTDTPWQNIQSTTYDPSTPLRVVGSRSHGNDRLADWLTQFGEHQLMPMGSSLKLCLVAEGKADIYPRFGLTSLWDTAAAQAVVESAGGVVVDPQGMRLSYANTAEVLNPEFLVCHHSSSEIISAWVKEQCPH